MVRAALIEEAMSSHARLIAATAGLTDPEVRATTQLPDWTVAHVLAHLVGNAQSHLRMFRGAAIDAVVDQYPTAGVRERDIELGATHGASELIGALTDSCSELEEAWRSLPDGAWQRLGAMTEGPPRTMLELVASRVREVELHHADLGRGYTPDDWPETFVVRELGERLASLPDRASHPELLAWLLARGPAPELGPW